MGGSYKQCSDCGKRALSIATRCPGCGREYPAPAVPDRAPGLDLDPGRFLSPGVIVGVVAAAVLGTVAEHLRTRSVAVADSSVATSEVAYATPAALPAEPEGELLVARTWTNVRKSRSTRGELEAMLMPSDTVLADSLERGWYRVALEGEVLGYVYHTTLVVPRDQDRR